MVLELGRMALQKSSIAVGLIGVLFSFLGCTQKAANGQSLPPPPRVAKKTPISFEQQWETFRKLGFSLNAGIDNSVVDDLRKDKSIEDKPYASLYMELGGTIQKEPWTPLTDRCWDFDTEAIEDHGAYVEVMKHLERISRGELKFENLKDFVDIEKEKAWVAFSIRGNNYKWDLKVDNDWVDPGLFTKVVGLTRTLRAKGRYTYFNTGGQNAVIGYETPEGRDALIKATGLKIEWLD